MPDDDPLAGRTLTRWEAAVLTGECPYVVGETWARSTARCATFEYKAHAEGYTGGGYPRWRSIERGPEVSRPGSGEVFVPVHRLAAVLWCYDAATPLPDVTDDLRGRDVHHTLGMPSANLPDAVETRDHGDHSAVTRTQLRAWAADAKRDRERQQQRREQGEQCAAPGCDAEVAATFADASERYCIECATDHANGRTIEII